MRNDRMGIAVIGAGMAGRSHAAGYRSATTCFGPGLPPVDLVAIADLNPQFAEETARRFGYARAESSWQAIAAAPDIDVVSVVVANHLHREVVLGLLAAGKHVLCEKPFAPSIGDAEAMVAAAAAAPHLQAGVGFTYRRSPAIAAVKQRVDSGAMGRIRHFNGRYWCDYGSVANGPMSWRYKGGPGSGALADIGSHLVDLAEFLCGPITSVRGAALSTFVERRALPLTAGVGHSATELSDVTEPVENEDLATFSAAFASGTIATISASRVAAGLANSLGFELFGEHAAATYDLDRGAQFGYFDRSVTDDTAGYRTVPVGPAHPYVSGGFPMDFPGVGYGQNDLFVFQARAFLEQVAGLDGLPRVPAFAEGLRNLRLLAAVTESARSGGAEVEIR
jgi:predicted dehydrogenase